MNEANKCGHCGCGFNWMDGAGKPIAHKDIVRINPTDNDWLDVVYRYKNGFELGSYIANPEPATMIKLCDILIDSNNPCLRVGNLDDEIIIKERS